MSNGKINIRILQTGSHKSVLLETKTRSMSLQIDPQKSMLDSMADTVGEMREKAQKALDRAAFIESAILQMQSDQEKAKTLAAREDCAQSATA